VYSTATIGSMLLSLTVPLVKLWYAVAAARALVALCVPFRVVSMNSSFLLRLKEIGSSRAGWYRGSQSLGVALLGPALAGVLVAHTNYWICYGLISACFAFMALFSRTFLPEEQVDGTHERAPLWRELAGMLQNRRVAESCFIELVSSSTTTLFTTFIIVLAVTVHGRNEAEAVFLVTMQGVASVGALFLLGPLLTSWPPRRLHALALPCAVLALLLLGTQRSLSLLAAAAVLLSLAAALVHLVNMLELSDVQFSKSKVAGLYNLSGMLGALVGATLGGLISEVVGLQTLFLVWAPVVLIAFIVCGLGRHLEFSSSVQGRRS
jgi:predicted MFS family arabinose efflux permease